MVVILDHPVQFAITSFGCSDRSKDKTGIELIAYEVTSLASTKDDTDNRLAVNSNVESRIKNLQAPPGVSPSLDLVFQAEENLTLKISVHTTIH